VEFDRLAIDIGPLDIGRGQSDRRTQGCFSERAKCAVAANFMDSGELADNTREKLVGLLIELSDLDMSEEGFGLVGSEASPLHDGFSIRAAGLVAACEIRFVPEQSR